MQNHSPHKTFNFCKTIQLIKKQQKDLVLHLIESQRCISRNVSVKAGFINYFSEFIVDLRKVDVSPKLLERLLVSSRFSAFELTELALEKSTIL